MAINNCINIFIGSRGLIANSLKKEFINKKKNFFISKDQLDLTNTSKIKKNHFHKFNKFKISLYVVSGIKKQYGDNKYNFKKNLDIIINLLEIISSLNIKKITFFSSCEVYGYQKKMIHENSIINTTTYYGISKILSESLIMNYCKQRKIKYLLLRLPQVFGINDYKYAYGPTYFINCLKENKDIFIWGNGDEKREFIYVMDVARIISILSKKDTNGILNITSGASISYKEILTKLREFKSFKVIKKKRSGEKFDIFYDNKLLKKIIGDFEFTTVDKFLRIMF